MKMRGKTLDIYETDDYMVSAGYESILPTDDHEIHSTGLIWYPYDPFPNQINILVTPISKNKYLIGGVE